MADFPEIKKLLFKTGEWHANRRKVLGGSDTNIIMGGDEDDIYKLWENKSGRAEPEDLSHILPVAMGCITEDLNLYWLQEHGVKKEITDLQTVFFDDKYPWMAAAVDGCVKLERGRAIVECKHTNAYSNRDKINDKYMPQFQHNMRCAGVEYAVVSVFFGNIEHDWWIVEENIGYQTEMMERLCWFWDCVQNDKEPFKKHKKVEAPPQKDRHKKIDMRTHNGFVSAAHDWIENKEANEKFNDAQKALKELILSEEEAAEMFVDGLTVKVAKNGSVRITQKKG